MIYIWYLLFAALASLVLVMLDIHAAIYRPKIPGRSTYFYTEVGSPETSHLNIPKEGEE